MCSSDLAAFLIRAVVDADAATSAIAVANANRNRPRNVELNSAAPALAWWNIQDRALWLVDLFERLERQDQERVSS